MADSSKILLGAADKGTDPVHPGTDYTKRFAAVFRAGTRFELVVVCEAGKNRESPYPPLADSTIERHYRAITLDELQKTGIAEVTADAELSAEATTLVSAIREAVFQAQVLPRPTMPEPDPVKVSLLANLELLLGTPSPTVVERVYAELADFGVDPDLPSDKKRESMLALIRRMLTLP